MKNPDETFEESKARKRRGQQGKAAEAKVAAVLNKLKIAGKLDFIRLLDARTCGRPVPQQPADYVVFREGRIGCLLEIKEISKGNRLPKKSFSQLPRMLSMAVHAHPILLVFLSDRNEWWSMRVHEMDPSAASWKIDEKLGSKVSNLEAALIAD